jgi:hypothetical protein
MLATMIVFNYVQHVFSGCNVIVLASGTLIFDTCESGLLSHNNLQNTS